MGGASKWLPIRERRTRACASAKNRLLAMEIHANIVRVEKKSTEAVIAEESHGWVTTRSQGSL